MADTKALEAEGGVLWKQGLDFNTIQLLTREIALTREISCIISWTLSASVKERLNNFFSKFDTATRIELGIGRRQVVLLLKQLVCPGLLTEAWVTAIQLCYSNIFLPAAIVKRLTNPWEREQLHVLPLSLWDTLIQDGNHHVQPVGNSYGVINSFP